MTALRQRFIEDLQLHGFATSTQQVYVTAVKLLAQHYHQPPDRLSEEQIRQYFLHLTHVRKVSRSNATITLCAIKFLYEHTLQRSWTRALLYHPHVHLLVSAGGWDAERGWMPAKHPKFLVPVRTLSVIFRAKMRQALKRERLLQPTRAKTWAQPWVVHC